MGSENIIKFKNIEIKNKFLKDKSIINLLENEGIKLEEIQEIIDKDILKYDSAICPMINKFKEYILPILQRLNLSYSYNSFGDFGDYIFSSDGNFYMNVNVIDKIESEDDIIRTGIYKQIFEKIKSKCNNINDLENLQGRIQAFISEGGENNGNYDIDISYYTGE